MLLQVSPVKPVTPNTDKRDSDTFSLYPKSQEGVPELTGSACEAILENLPTASPDKEPNNNNKNANKEANPSDPSDVDVEGES
jgi:hypothetical protein